jgi:hypothetical protein
MGILKLLSQPTGYQIQELLWSLSGRTWDWFSEFRGKVMSFCGSG